jgi:hypothetical protein
MTVMIYNDVLGTMRAVPAVILRANKAFENALSNPA